jgi:hypothetical protein
MTFKVDLRQPGASSRLLPYVCGWCGDLFAHPKDLIEHVAGERAGEGK